MRFAPFAVVTLAALSAPVHAINVDGRIDPAEWEGAQRVTDFRIVEPLTGAPASQPTEAWILATPEGLAIGFRNTQPTSVPRTRQRTQRDEDAQVDRVNLMVDFDGDGRTGYNFTLSSTDGITDSVITNETQFSKDWDGNWKHAVSEDGDTWSAEMLIPWYIAPMRKGSDGKRRLGIYLDRVIGSTGERVAWPAASFQQARFLSDFTRIEVPQYSQSLLAVTPYVAGVYDNIRGKEGFDTGADIFWKPNGQFQMTATINPDFGQVESDDLVVNFSANETFFSDKRPFFTENQGLFEFTTPSDFSQLVYTRRVGGPEDDGDGAGDITAAIKVNGSFGATKYGILAAEEADAVGRSFRALRLVRDFDKQNVGVMLTQVERPFLDRNAMVLGVDHNWRPTDRISVQTRLLGSDIDQSGNTTRGSGATVYVNYQMGGGWRQNWLAMHFSDDLQINDFGFLSRNNLNYLNWEVQRRFTDLPAESRYSSKDWRFRISGTDNDHGLRLQRQLRISRQSSLRDGSSEYAQVNINSAGYDDRLTRGKGELLLPPSFNANAQFERPRKGNWAFEGYVNAFSGGLAGNRNIGYSFGVEPTYFISDAFSVFSEVAYERTPDWLVWQTGNLIGGFDERSLQLDAGVNWTIGSKQELRVKLQALGLDAKLKQGYRVSEGRAVASNDPIDSFSLNTLGFQIRYRYELAPLSYLYVVYGRGGFDQNAFSEDTGNLVRNSFELRDDEQLLVKLSYRFEL